ncbi:hypothetical protein KNE206_35750 [Kitasatospora sp. NE20-6]|uniref:hypothetical protein n=1 Tax=Kitasatospora sp. NE20-6 TaxID=2859066 RepID=UPI0034DBEB06
MAAAATAGPRRGRLRMADRVYARLAEQAVRQALAETWAARAVRGVPPRATVLVVGGTARITLHLELPYPADLAELSRKARHAAADQVVALTGTPVVEVSVLVERLAPAALR